MIRRIFTNSFVQEVIVGSGLTILVVIGVFMLQTNTALGIPVSEINSVIGKEGVAQPEKILIPAIKVNATIEPVGLNTEGRINTPQNLYNVGWFNTSNRPGEIGTAVLDGHVDNGISKSGVFSKLENLKIGDEFVIVTKTNQVIHFKVTDINVYPISVAPIEEILSPDKEKSIIHLITCAGYWDKNTKSYSDRLVVTAEKI